MSTMTIPEIIVALNTDNIGVFPRKAVTEAIAQREAVIPELLRILKETTSNIAEVAGREHYLGHIFAMYLVAQFREELAYQPLVDLVSADWTYVDRVLGDIVTEDLGRILASACNGDTGLICGMVENANLNEYVRSAGLEALVVLVAQEIKTREEVMAYFQSLFNGKLERQSSFVWGSLVSKCCRIGADEIAVDIDRAFADGLVETLFISPQSARRGLAIGKDQALARLAEAPSYRFIEDTVREMAGWHCFQKPSRSSKSAQMRTVSKVGRNEPCPCGSGKKYKKCCGGV